ESSFITSKYSVDLISTLFSRFSDRVRLITFEGDQGVFTVTLTDLIKSESISKENINDIVLSIFIGSRKRPFLRVKVATFKPNNLLASLIALNCLPIIPRSS